MLISHCQEDDYELSVGQDPKQIDHGKTTMPHRFHRFKNRLIAFNLVDHQQPDIKLFSLNDRGITGLLGEKSLHYNTGSTIIYSDSLLFFHLPLYGGDGNLKIDENGNLEYWDNPNAISECMSGLLNHNQFSYIIVKEPCTQNPYYPGLYVYENWLNGVPERLNFINLPNLTGIERDQNRLLVTSNQGIYVFDITNPAEPERLQVIPIFALNIHVQSDKLIVITDDSIYKYAFNLATKSYESISSTSL
jgi:hypothetical protein